MERIRVKRRERNDRLKIGDSVIITNRFFSNHGLKKSLVGTGQVLSVSIPYITVEFKTHYIFMWCKEKGFIKSLKFIGTDKSKLVIEINSVYLEKCK